VVQELAVRRAGVQLEQVAQMEMVDKPEEPLLTKEELPELDGILKVLQELMVEALVKPLIKVVLVV
jgi:hypothetical protein